MSKLIVEMEMPQACPCEFAYYSSHGIFRPCFAWNGIPARWHEVEKCAENGTRPDWCPIVGVLPDEHGDLVDTDTVLWEVLDSEGIETAEPVTVGDVIEGYDVPIVIAAERKDNGTTAD